MSSGYIDLPVTGGGSGSGTVTEVDSGTGLTGGPITTTGTLAVNVGTSASKIPQLNADSQIALADGTSSKPQYSFASETNTGWYRSATGDLVLVVDGVQAAEFLKVGSNVNMGFGPSGTVSPSASNPLAFESTFNGAQFFQYNNASTGSSSQTIFQVLNGNASANNATEFGNAAYLATGYLSGGSWVSATAFQSQLNIMSESSSGAIKFNVGGRTSGTERAVLTPTTFQLENGANFMPSQYTTVAKLALTVAEGTMVYDTTLHQMSYYNGTSWINV